MITSQRSFRPSIRSSLAVAAISTLVLAVAAAPASAAAATMTLSRAGGASGAGGTVIGTVPAISNGPATFVAGVLPTVQFQYMASATSTCATTARAVQEIAVSGTTPTGGVLTVDPEEVKRISGTKIAFNVPTEPYPEPDVNPNGLVLAGGQKTAKWNVCVYDSESATASTLLATSQYTVVLRPTITGILPASSPAAGGQTITVNGTGFTALATPITAAIGGTALTNIKVAANGSSFTATTGARAADTGLALTVNTPGGTVSSLDPDNNGIDDDPSIPFSYTNGITISPTLAAAGSLVTVDVLGAGFSQLSFDHGSPTTANAHVFLVNGTYDAAANRGVAECKNASVISDAELICTLNLADSRLNPVTSASLPGSEIFEGAYTLTVVANGSTSAGSAAGASIVSSGATFTVGPY
ncbi:hypothetical protein Q0Z83_105220 [Actinoplanes sichuanensis]|nr:hypothetical protein Q0Z83_105220 [Actinoplanes sichuanensis]